MSIEDVLEDKEPTAASHQAPEDSEIRRLLELANVEIAEIETSLNKSQPLHHITHLNLTGCGLSKLPDGFATVVPNLSILFLSNNRFSEMPAVIGEFRELQMVAFKSNQMQSIHPDALQPQLRWLILTDNQISVIPETIGRCTRLQKCMLSGNRIQCIPDVMKNCQRLELIRLASNQLTEPPMVLLNLPSLAWIALSDNPFLKECLVSHDLASSEGLRVLHDLDCATPQPDEVWLGQGAGGVTRKMWYHGKAVAVKTYGNASSTMTSDGLPAEERRISCAASALPNCPAVIQHYGQTANGSLVMEYLDGYKAIADPPSFDSCSRDVYPVHSPARSLTVRQGCAELAILFQTLTALHKSGICHGDFYGHNVLMRRDDNDNTESPLVRLTDFGAAFFYDKQQPYGALLERIELRAFGILVEEINELVIGGPVDFLSQLAKQCKPSIDSGACDSTNFDSVFIWWKQQELAKMAKAFGVGLSDDVGEIGEEKDSY